MKRAQLNKTKRWIVKIGSALLTNNGQGLDEALIQALVDQILALKNQGVQVVLVSSGAVAEGMKRLGWAERPSALYELQAAAAVGQMGLVQAYESRFIKHGVHTAQILLTHEDLSDRRRYLNARSTLTTLLDMGVVPVVNENDTVATDEIRFGDNDTLAALVANLVEADVLMILTDQAGVYDQDPRNNPNAKLIGEAQAGDTALEAMSTGGGGKFGRGGMLAKVKAAERAARSGAATVIASGKEFNLLSRIYSGESIGTYLFPAAERMAARKRWLASQLQVAGRVVLDDGAVKVLRHEQKSLLAVGVVAVEGEFYRGELVCCVDKAGQEIARGLVNYSSAESNRIKGLASKQIESVLGYVDEPELINRDNLVLTAK